ncbi:PAS domain-containing protein [Sediminihabitans luteus]|uniref:PAS domain-containing protein n=1 Tax=Sediminihabitans luteus TaxID=1138585 RepID=A0A2M9CCY6_9CELL|nr:PAS and ANTAR domain-containing protein [Sediminihabitans luteus]PJJ69224.1 PAS domain-containing protein [Sediminihabitans luteus]GII98900.1 putative transcription antitermination regulator [Sediminihabitans luteus]
MDAPRTDRDPLVGWYSWDLTTGDIRWSDDMFTIYGFAPGEVVPTTSLIAHHKHPEDRESWAELLDRLRRGPGEYAHWHRVVDVRGESRYVVSVGRATGPDDPGGARVEGYLVDVDGPQSSVTQHEVATTLANFREGAARIEQAKGVIMVLRACDGDDAFEVLRSASNTLNVRLRELARQVVEAAAQGGPVAVRVEALLGSPAAR